MKNILMIGLVAGTMAASCINMSCGRGERNSSIKSSVDTITANGVVDAISGPR